MSKKMTRARAAGNTTCYSSIPAEKLNEAIRKKAKELYEKSGRKPGNDLENWVEAERIVKAEMCGDTTRMPC